MSVTGVSPGILTFLIADVRGYTTFTQQHGDEAAARLAEKFAELTREGVAAHGGEVTELRGDEALAVFTSPRAALRAAADLQVVFADETAVDPRLPMTVGIGIDAGEAVPVQGGYRGGALNLAARLCSRAVAGEVLVSQGIAHLARAVDGITLEEAGDAEVKGLREPVRVFRAVSDVPPYDAAATPAGELPAALEAAAPLIGREEEIRRLRWRWRWVRRGPAAAVLVHGPAGIGKTRLLAELAATAAGSGGGCRYVTATSPWQPLRSQDVPAIGLLVIDDLDAAASDVVEDVTHYLRSAPPGLLVALAADDDAAPAELFEALRRLAGGADAVVRPRPLTTEQMLQVARLYVGDAVDALPADVLSGSAGVPRSLHERISVWAHEQASQRLGVLATQAAAGRSDLRSVESDLAGTVVDLQQVRERARLFGLGPGRHAVEPSQPPYRGLTSFDVDDAEFFFGRERLVAEMVSRLAGARFLGVVGPSGSGKSSAVRAGLVPALRGGTLPGSDAWAVCVTRPGEHPFRALDRSLWGSLPKPWVDRIAADTDAGLGAVTASLRDDERLVLVIDQFEEAFTLCHDASERTAYLRALADAVDDPQSRVVVIVAIRADYYGRCAADARLAELLTLNHVLVGPMSGEEYRRAIVQPALRVGVTLEPALVDDLVTEVLGEPGALPLLSTALLELWHSRRGRTIERSAYVETGGVHGAVGRLADEVYDALAESDQSVARGILLRLTGPGEGESVVDGGCRSPSSTRTPTPPSAACSTS